MSYIEKIKLLVDKESLRKYYCEDFLNVEKCANVFGVTCHAIQVLLKEYNLQRDKHEAKSKTNSIVKNRYYNEVKQRVTKEILEQFYIIEDNSYENCTKEFNISGWILDRLLKDYGLHKDKKISCKRSVLTRRENAGGKEEYAIKQIAKSKETIIQKYGSIENFYQKRKEKTENNNIEKYGYKYKRTADLLITHNEKYQKVLSSKEESIKYLESFPQKPKAEELMADLNCNLNNIYLWLEKYELSNMIKNTKSRKEQDIVEFIQSLGFEVKTNFRKAIAPMEVDIFVPSRNLAIEFNGNYWYSNEKGADKFYHFNKSFACENKGIRLIHIYEYQWSDPIKREILKSIIMNALGKNDRKIFARKCEIKELTKRDVVEFSEMNSLHGHRNASIYLGLFYENELVEIMSFGKAFFSRDTTIDYECIRSITKINTTVVGGMNKLFNYFVNKYNPQKVLYYVDYNTHNGSSMPKLGFEFESYSKVGLVNVSNCKEVTEKYGKVFNRKPQKYKEIQEYINQGKILTIYDCGVKRYIWKNKNK